MKRSLGQILRFVGLLIELLGILVLVFRTGTDEQGVPLPGSWTPRVAWELIVAGFAIWLAGTIVNYWIRTGKHDKGPRKSSLDLNL
jgi:uncharacterized membrane protein